MKNALLLACLALPLSSAAALQMGDSPALDQAGAVQTSGGAATYDNNPSRGSVAALPGAVREDAQPCADETCGLRRGGPPPSELRREPKSPITREKEDQEREARKAKGKFNWMGLAMIGLSAAGGALAGFLIAGPIGAIVGGVLGGLFGWLAPKLLHR